MTMKNPCNKSYISISAVPMNFIGYPVVSNINSYHTFLEALSSALQNVFQLCKLNKKYLYFFSFLNAEICLCLIVCFRYNIIVNELLLQVVTYVDECFFEF